MMSIKKNSTSLATAAPSNKPTEPTSRHATCALHELVSSILLGHVAVRSGPLGARSVHAGRGEKVTNMSLTEIARALGGDASSGQVLAPGPGHSARERSLAVRLSSVSAYGLICHSFAGEIGNCAENTSASAWESTRPA